MSVQADMTRNKRRHFAAPGGSHDRLIKFLAAALPAAVGVLAAFMVLAPLSPRGEISFLLDRTKVQTVANRLQVADAMVRGQDNSGRGFSLTAGSAVQKTAANKSIEMRDLVARMMLPAGPAILTAGSGAYGYGDGLLNVFGPVNVRTADGYRMTANDMNVDLADKSMRSRGRVEGSIPAGTFSADRILADLEARTITLDGNARLRMVPGKLSMPGGTEGM